MKKCKGQLPWQVGCKRNKIGRSTSLLVMASKFTCEASKFTCEASKLPVYSPWRVSLLARRVKRSNPQSWRGTNPLVKKPLLAMASVSTWEANSDRTGHIKAHFVHFKGINWGEDSLGHQRKRENKGKTQREPKEQEAQGLKEDTRSLRHHGLVQFHLFFSSCKVTMTMSN